MSPKFIIESFWQKRANCVAIVLIKAAMLQYGLTRVFQRKKLPGNWVISLKNNDIVAISVKDVERLNKKNRIIFRRSVTGKKGKSMTRIKEYVKLCFAVMVRRIQSYGYEGKEYTVSGAIRLLTEEGMNTARIHELLGLSRKTKRSNYLSVKDLKSFNKKKAVLLYSDKHIVAVSKGYYDNYGRAVKLGTEPPILEGRKAKAWFELKY